jgi:hypothetical protein
METAPRYLQDPPAIEVGDSCSTMEVYEEFDSLAGDPNPETDDDVEILGSQRVSKLFVDVFESPPNIDLDAVEPWNVIPVSCGAIEHSYQLNFKVFIDKTEIWAKSPIYMELDTPNWCLIISKEAMGEVWRCLANSTVCDGVEASNS